MGNKIVTEADRKATPRPKPLNGYTLPTGGRGQKVSLERGMVFQVGQAADPERAGL